MVAGDLEYLFVLCRSMYDLLQATMVGLWKRARLHGLPNPHQLPRSFRKVVLNEDDSLRTSEQITKMFRLPDVFAEAYLEHAEFFGWLRSYRDQVAHQGRDFRLIFETEHGFAISTQEEPFKSMDIWCEENTTDNGLGSVRSVACHICWKTLVAMDTLMYRYSELIQCPPPVAPNCCVFVRGPTVKELVFVEQGVRDDPWMRKSA